MIGRIARTFLVALLLALGLVGGASAAGNPSGTGQPSQSCQSEPRSPGNAANTSGAAFNPNGTAATNYAGSPGTPSQANGAATAVSQYDVACYQVSQH